MTDHAGWVVDMLQSLVLGYLWGSTRRQRKDRDHD